MNDPRIHPKTVLIAAGLCCFAAGCGDRDQVRSYTIPKEEPPPMASEILARQAEEANLPTGEMAWDLPEGWQDVENANPLRSATIAAGEGDAAIEVAVSRLGGAAGGVTANVNRWRGQIGLDPASAQEIEESVIPVSSGQANGLIVDLVGPASGDDESAAPRMLAAIFPARDSTWFIKTVGTVATIDPHWDGFVEMCESVRFTGGGGDDAARAESTPAPAPVPAPVAAPVAAPTTTPPAAPGTPAWGDLPEGWTLDATPRPMSVGSMTISDGGQQASMTITPLGGRQDLLSNINRWRGQVGTAALTSLDEDPPVEIEVAGQPGHLVDVAGANGRTIAVIAVRGERTWFYKLTGPDPLVAGQREAFESFIRTLRFGDASDE